jgi:hypothetical protein
VRKNFKYTLWVLTFLNLIFWIVAEKILFKLL